MMSTIDAPVRQVRYVELDSLRGLAALMVVLFHVLNLWQADAQPASVIIRYFLGLEYPFGTDAMLLFFVLSGFVLSLPAINGKPQTYPTFLIRRVFCIYVPYLPALLVSVAGAFWLHGIITRSIWFHPFWSEPVNWGLVGQHVLFLSLSNTDQFDPPIWSLVYEMRISLIFPLLCGLVLRLKSRWSLVIAGGLTTIPILIERLLYHLDGSGFNSPHYAGLLSSVVFLHARGAASERGFAVAAESQGF
ncbi:MAG: acyltransferase [Terracidiphilus sp.]|jgi:peptidoglycan/LPS O-acetylase OafA/YrhL